MSLFLLVAVFLDSGLFLLNTQEIAIGPFFWISFQTRETKNLNSPGN